MLPSNVNFGFVEGRFLVAIQDGPDAGEHPDGIPNQGSIHFNASIPYVIDPSADPDPVVIHLAEIVGGLDAEGYLCVMESDGAGGFKLGARGVHLVATDDPDLMVTDWTWNVTYKFDTINGIPTSIEKHGIAVPMVGAVDLPTAVKVPASPGYGMPQAEAAVLRAEAIAHSIREDADSGVFNGEAATLVFGTVTSGTTAAVVNVGDEQHAILNITLEKGDKGDTGTGVPDAGAALQVMRMDSDGIATEWVTPSKTIVGLSNVDNTADADKPISGPTELALETKQNKLIEDPDDPGFYLIGG